jgi:hypothetical protein
MYILYVDESGDTGLINSPTKYFILSGIVVHELRWATCLEQLTDFRKRMLVSYGLHLREEIHASEFICKPGNLQRIAKYHRLAILREFSKELSTMNDINIINIAVDKTNKPNTFNIFETAWKALLQRFENTIRHKNFPGPYNPDERGIIISDQNTNQQLKLIFRKMRKYNPIPNQAIYGVGYRNITLQYLIEDPNFRDSKDSYFIQAADLVAYLLMQKKDPNSYMRKKGGHNYFNNLDPILCKVACNTDPQGVVLL